MGSGDGSALASAEREEKHKWCWSMVECGGVQRMGWGGDRHIMNSLMLEEINHLQRSAPVLTCTHSPLLRGRSTS